MHLVEPGRVENDTAGSCAEAVDEGVGQQQLEEHTSAAPCCHTALVVVPVYARKAVVYKRRIR